MHQAPFILGALLTGLILAFAFFHPLMKNLNQTAEENEEEEDEYEAEDEDLGLG